MFQNPRNTNQSAERIGIIRETQTIGRTNRRSRPPIFFWGGVAPQRHTTNRSNSLLMRTARTQHGEWALGSRTCTSPDLHKRTEVAGGGRTHTVFL